MTLIELTAGWGLSPQLTPAVWPSDLSANTGNAKDHDAV